MKIPLGYGYLLHQAKGAGDLGSLVSHGCVRVMRDDIYDLSEKIVAAREAEISDAEIQKAKQTKVTVIAEMDSSIPVEITYDTMVVERRRASHLPGYLRTAKEQSRNFARRIKNKRH